MTFLYRKERKPQNLTRRSMVSEAGWTKLLANTVWLSAQNKFTLLLDLFGSHFVSMYVLHIIVGVSKRRLERIIYHEPIYNFAFLSNIISITELTQRGGKCINWNSCNILVGKIEGNKPLARTRYRWGKTVCYEESACDNMGWISLVRDTDQWHVFVNMVMKFRIT